MSVNLEQWISDHNIDEVECIVPDINGVQRGKVLPAKKFLSSVKDKSLRIPGSVFICTIDGHYPEDIADIWDKDPDKILIADPDTRSDEHTSDLTSLMSNTYAVFSLK